ncbi:MAG: hypothetical protein LAO30_17000 [Acidobacteriia bacterium]|nr:hypothetical protein [Terriglobia bacterium]
MYEAPDASFHGFTYQNGTYAAMDYPGATDTNLNGINDRGDMIGSYSTDAEAHYHGFVFKDGAFTSFDVPFVTSLTNTFPQGINNHGEIVGDYYDSSGYHLGFSAEYQ